MCAEVEAVRSGVALLRNLMSAKQLSLLAELRALYPIGEVVRGHEYTIRGIALPDRDLHLLGDEQVPTALGYVAHLVSLLGKYLGVPLRYYPHFMASRSVMRDEVISGATEYPLYYTRTEQSAFFLAVLMLQRDVRQLLHSQGVAVLEGHMLANVVRLFAVLLDAPLPAVPEVAKAVEAVASPVDATAVAAAAAPAAPSGGGGRP